MYTRRFIIKAPHNLRANGDIFDVVADGKPLQDDGGW